MSQRIILINKPSGNELDIYDSVFTLNMTEEEKKKSILQWTGFDGFNWLGVLKVYVQDVEPWLDFCRAYIKYFARHNGKTMISSCDNLRTVLHCHALVYYKGDCIDFTNSKNALKELIKRG